MSIALHLSDHSPQCLQGMKRRADEASSFLCGGISGNVCFLRTLSRAPSLTVSYTRRFIFSGALVPKQIKRLLKMKGLSAVVARDAESVLTMEEAMDAVRSAWRKSGSLDILLFMS